MTSDKTGLIKGSFDTLAKPAMKRGDIIIVNGSSPMELVWFRRTQKTIQVLNILGMPLYGPGGKRIYTAGFRTFFGARRPKARHKGCEPTLLINGLGPTLTAVRGKSSGIVY